MNSTNSSTDRIIEIPRFYGSLSLMLKKFDKYARQDAFAGSTVEEFESWKKESRETLKEIGRASCRERVS